MKAGMQSSCGNGGCGWGGAGVDALEAARQSPCAAQSAFARTPWSTSSNASSCDSSLRPANRLRGVLQFAQSRSPIADDKGSPSLATEIDDSKKASELMLSGSASGAVSQYGESFAKPVARSWDAIGTDQSGSSHNPAFRERDHQSASPALSATGSCASEFASRRNSQASCLEGWHRTSQQAVPSDHPSESWSAQSESACVPGSGTLATDVDGRGLLGPTLVDKEAASAATNIAGDFAARVPLEPETSAASAPFWSKSASHLGKTDLGLPCPSPLRFTPLERAIRDGRDGASSSRASLLEARLAALEVVVDSHWSHLRNAALSDSCLAQDHARLAQEHASLAAEHGVICEVLLQSGLLSSLRHFPLAEARCRPGFLGLAANHRVVIERVVAFAGEAAAACLACVSSRLVASTLPSLQLSVTANCPIDTVDEVHGAASALRSRLAPAVSERTAVVCPTVTAACLSAKSSKGTSRCVRGDGDGTSMKGNVVASLTEVLRSVPSLAVVLGAVAGLRASDATRATSRDWNAKMHAAWPELVETAPVEVYLLGGHEAHSSNPCGVVESLTVDQGCWEAMPAESSARACATAVTLGGAIYLVGGIDADRPVAWCDRFCPDLGSWDQLPPMRAPRHSCSAAAVRGHLHVVGGLDDWQHHGSAAYESFDPDTSVWITRPTNPMLSGTCVASAAKGVLYVAGFAENGEVTLQRFNEPRGGAGGRRHWLRLSAAQPPFRPLGLVGAATVDTRVFILGTCVRELRVYDVQDGAWQPPPPTVHLPDPVRWGSSVSMTFLGGQLFIFGVMGEDGDRGVRGTDGTVVSGGKVVGVRLSSRAGEREKWTLLPSPTIHRSYFAAAALRRFG
eukprot:TRINITY_DN55858_c0_g1_i1.p1 TRINITY_DN55858_c0_g1~~TRINITY_DN55858_c0_g1_i1.p1  ORF type:complete len:855 (+),score=120.94 TRINITY_DN55858_c0_g1_i1:136-2700(+)